ncbi:MAG TPA: thioesterase family protein [Acidimicrobiales bacterium]
MTTAAFFERVGDDLVPRAHASSPWGADLLHGRLLAGLAAAAVEEQYGDGGFLPVRLTVDLFRAAPMAPVRLRSAVVRDGGRVRAVDASVECEGRQVARLAALFLRRAEQPPGRVWTAPAWDVPGPEDVPAPVLDPGALDAGVPDLRPIGGPLTDAADRKRAWLRDRRPLVEGEATPPVARAVMAADVVNPLSNWGDGGLHFINADLTVHLVRPPRGEWIGLDITDHLDRDGIAVGQCSLYDTQGRVGHAEVCSVARPRFSR